MRDTFVGAPHSPYLDPTRSFQFSLVRHAEAHSSGLRWSEASSLQRPTDLPRAASEHSESPHLPEVGERGEAHGCASVPVFRGSDVVAGCGLVLELSVLQPDDSSDARP